MFVAWWVTPITVPHIGCPPQGAPLHQVSPSVLSYISWPHQNPLISNASITIPPSVSLLHEMSPHQSATLHQVSPSQMNDAGHHLIWKAEDIKWQKKYCRRQLLVKGTFAAKAAFSYLRGYYFFYFFFLPFNYASSL